MKYNEKIRRQFVKAKTIEELNAHVIEFASVLMVDHITCGQVFGVGGKPDAKEEFGFFNQAHMAEYMANGYFYHDPCVKLGYQSRVPFTFREAVKTIDMTDQAERVMERARAHGVNEGFVVPLNGSNGQLSLFTAAGNDFPAEPDAETRSKLIDIAIEGHTRARAIRGFDKIDGVQNPLTPRQREVMECLARDMRPEQIANSLNLSTKQVRDHIRNARLRLDAKTNSAAVARCLMRGFI